LNRLFRISKALVLSKAKGFTLLEAMMAMAVLIIAMAVIFYAFTASMRIFTSELSETDASFEAHRAMERMTKELKGALEIVTATGTSVAFWYSDANGNGTREAGETVKYTWTGTTDGLINRTVQTSTLEIATGVKRINITYNDPSPLNIRIINILITVKKDSTLSTLESSVDIRNL
jgi:type II secretory pathway pseudopilin PulG